VDGDDWISASAYANLATLMDRHNADFGWLRAVIFHERKAEFWPFYDQDIRNAVLDNRRLAITNLEALPILGGMEPQCCNRVYSSAFLRERAAAFPEGIVYEDLPFHFGALFAAERIVLTNETGYFYRTQRRGKITDRNDQTRFDLVKAIAIMNNRVFAGHPQSAAGPHVVSFLAQFAVWCVMSVHLELRAKLVSELAVEFQRLPGDWIYASLRPNALPLERAYMLWQLLEGNTSIVQQLNSARAQPEADISFMVSTGRQEPAAPKLDTNTELPPQPKRRGILRQTLGRVRCLVRP